MQVNDRNLLKILLAGALLTAISIVFVPLDTMNDSLADHGVQQQLVSQAEAALDNPIPAVKSKEQPALRQSTSQINAPKKSTRNATYYQPPVKYHTVFSTGCSTFQDWQSYVFFYHALQSGQEGHITRIASGCEGETKDELERIFKDEIASMDPERLHLHQTPEFGKVGGLKRSFKYFNKPFGMRHWFENVLGYPENHAEHDDSIVILLDPDQILLRPFTDDFTHSSETWRLKDDSRHKLKVEHGSPFSQQYGYGLQWLYKVNQTYVFDGPTPVATMTKQEAADYYNAMGPPYVATAKDMYAIVKTWSDIVPRVRDQYPYLLAEMFAFNIAAAHLGLRHTLAFSFMVSDVGTGGEGWPLVEKVDANDVCHNYPKTEYVSFCCSNDSKHHLLPLSADFFKTYHHLACYSHMSFTIVNGIY